LARLAWWAAEFAQNADSARVAVAPFGQAISRIFSLGLRRLPGPVVACAWAAACRSWVAAAPHGEHTERFHGREPAGAAPAPQSSRVPGLAFGLGRRITLGLAVQLRGPGLYQVIHD
jgi:hypothetical protein